MCWCRRGCSPLARGWSPPRAPPVIPSSVLPARAGMVPGGADAAGRGPGAPRSRGDGPGTTAYPDTPEVVLPARAGMVPPARPSGSRPSSAPRSRGDGPSEVAVASYIALCSPLARGWSAADRDLRKRINVLPARAGMVRRRRRSSRPRPRAPRSRGDGPHYPGGYRHDHLCSPLARGWSDSVDVPPARGAVLPARAGMVPTGGARCRSSGGAPRSRGDGPSSRGNRLQPRQCSPLARGWSSGDGADEGGHSMLPARAGMVPFPPASANRRRRAPRSRGDGPQSHGVTRFYQMCSPLARGWSPEPDGDRVRAGVLPARAGMVPSTAPAPSRPGRAPRSRGDGPVTAFPEAQPARCSPLARGWSSVAEAEEHLVEVLPARAGMVRRGPCRPRRRTGAPRSRGDGPPSRRPRSTSSKCSPLARGWSGEHCSDHVCRGVLPARAGMVPTRGGIGDPGAGAPRSRGDGPHARHGRTASARCSPLARGWSPCVLVPIASVVVLPARAGMVPPMTHRPDTQDGAPRSRGDGPLVVVMVVSWYECSPLARGWSRRRGRPCLTGQCSPLARGWSWAVRAPAVRRGVLPARAGMVPGRADPAGRGAGAPRSRGDGPHARGHRRPRGRWCSPLARGWSRRVGAGVVGEGSAPRSRGDGPGGSYPAGSGSGTARPVLPARAGMVPTMRSILTAPAGAPRSRGDGPASFGTGA